MGAAGDGREETPSQLYARIRAEMIDAERARVLLVRSTGTVPSEVVSQVLGMLDIEESMLDAGSEAPPRVRIGSLALTGGRQCDDLQDFPAIETAADPACATCLVDGTRWVSLRECLTAATSAAATPPSASTRAPTSTRTSTG